MLTRVNSDDQFTICTNLVLCTCMAVISQKKESDPHTESLINTFRLDQGLDAGSRSRSTLTRRGRGRRREVERGVPCCLFFRVTHVNESLSYGWVHALRPLLRFVSTARCGLASCRRSSDGPRVGSQFRSHVVVNIDALES